MKENIIGAIAIVAFVVAIFAVATRAPSPEAQFGATAGAGGMLAENYIPYILYNGGYNSAKDITTTGNIFSAIGQFSASMSLGSSTPSAQGNFTLDSSATTTIFIASSATTKGACLQFQNTAGVATRAYVGNAGNAFIVEAGSCK